MADYADAKRLPVAFLQGLGLSDIHVGARPTVRILYLGEDGAERAVRFRTSLTGSRFRWRKGSKPRPYGLWRLDEAKQARRVTIVEGESDAQTLWYHTEPALGLPGASTWREDWAPYLDGIERINVVIEPDRGGQAMLAWVRRSVIRDRVWLVSLAGFKDPSALHVDSPEAFRARWDATVAAAPTWRDIVANEERETGQRAYEDAYALLRDPALLARVATAISQKGYAGDTSAPLLAYLAVTSRLLTRPINLAFIAPSASGKNAAIDAAVELFPPDAVYTMHAGSGRALVYTDEEFTHRIVIVGEADSIPDEGPAASAVRALATENRLVYDVVQKTSTGQFETRHIIKKGPTGLITTSTRSLATQLGTRMLEVPIRDDEEQTRSVLRAHAAAVNASTAPAPDVRPFHALQTWLATGGERRVVVPFARTLGDLVSAKAVRMRRDFQQLLACVQAVALLYQHQRDRTDDGAIIATLADYAAVRELLAPIFDTIVLNGLTPAIRATVEAIESAEEVSLPTLAARLGIADSTASWRVKRAVKGGWLVNLETRRGHAARLRRGAALPETVSALPAPEVVRGLFESSSAHRDEAPPPPPPANETDAGDYLEGR